MTTPTLHDDRIEAMRTHVMHTVDQDIRRRGRRLRGTIGLTAASVLVVGLGGYAISALGSSTNESASDSVASDSAGASSAERPDALVNEDSRAAPEADRKVITTGSISVTVSKPRETAGALSAYVERLGGRVDNRSEQGDGEDATASLQVRVPSTKVSATIDRLETYGTVEDVSLQNDDVTSVSQDLDARIDALQISVDRLEAILGAADTSKEVISAESALTKRQEQLESLQAQRRSLENKVELSTLTIDLAQRQRVDSVEPGGFSGGLRDGWNGLVSTVNGIVEVGGLLLPWAALAMIGVLVVRVLARRRTGRR